MRKYTDIQEIILHSDLASRGQTLFLDSEIRQKLTIRDNGEIQFERILYSGRVLETVLRTIPEETVNEVFFSIKQFAAGGDRPRIPDMGSWSIVVTRASQDNRTLRGSVLFGSNPREMKLSDYIRERVRIPRMFLFDGVPFHRILPDRTRAIYEFSKKWIDIINHSPTWIYLMKTKMMDELAELYFDLDFGRSFEIVYQKEGDRGDVARLREKIPQIHNVEILGSAIYSQVYYYIYHAEEPEVHFEQAEVWLTAALARLFQLTRDVEY